MRIGIVGAEAAKFTPDGEAQAKKLIRDIVYNAVFNDYQWVMHSAPPDVTIVSGGCHLGGIDIWAEEIADASGLGKLIHKPAVLSWDAGYKPRNLAIARDSDVLHCIVVEGLPDSYKGMRFKECYHCAKHGEHKPHVKSGGCWTMWKAVDLGKRVYLHIIDNGD